MRRSRALAAVLVAVIAVAVYSGVYNLPDVGPSTGSSELYRADHGKHGAFAISGPVTTPIAAETGPGPAVTPTPSTPTPPTRTFTTSGHVYYVSLSGNDANAGTRASPYRTLPKGVRALAPGDTLYVRGGTYLLRSRLSVECSGTASAPITIASYPGETAIVSGDVNRNGVCDVTDTPTKQRYGSLIRIAGGYVRLKNLKVAYSGGRGIFTTGKHDVISGNSVHHTWDSAIYLAGPHNTARGNRVWRASASNYGRSGDNDWSAGIAWGDPFDAKPPGRSPHIRILNNVVYHVSGEGIMGMRTDFGVVEGNICYDNWAVTGIYLDQCSYITVKKNLVYWTGNSAWSRFASGVTGILLSNERIGDAVYPIGHDCRVINNIVVGTGSNICFWTGSVTGSALVNDLVAANTLVNAKVTAIEIDAGRGASHVNTRITDNLVLQSGGRAASVASVTGLSFDHNLWSRAPAASASSPTDVIGDPLLRDAYHLRSPGKVLASWYQLTAASPARGRGVFLPEVLGDFFGNLRNEPPDVGAHEYQP